MIHPKPKVCSDCLGKDGHFLLDPPPKKLILEGLTSRREAEPNREQGQPGMRQIKRFMPEKRKFLPLVPQLSIPIPGSNRPADLGPKSSPQFPPWTQSQNRPDNTESSTHRAENVSGV